MPYLFLSYSRKDTPTMNKVKNTLQKAGYEVWTDEGIHVGTEVWENTIEDKLKRCAGVIVIQTPDSSASKWVRRELTMAERFNKPIFPLLAHSSGTDSFILRLSTHQRINIESDFEIGMERLINEIEVRRLMKPRISVMNLPRVIPAASTRGGKIFYWIAGIVVVALAAIAFWQKDTIRGFIYPPTPTQVSSEPTQTPTLTPDPSPTVTATNTLSPTATDTPAGVIFGPLNTIAISEVNADPCGYIEIENGNEYIELFNFGSLPVDVGGLWIVDRPHSNTAEPDQIVAWKTRVPFRTIAENLIYDTTIIPPNSYAVILTPTYLDVPHPFNQIYEFAENTIILTIAESQFLGDEDRGLTGTSGAFIDFVVLYSGTETLIEEVVSTYGTPNIASDTPGEIRDNGDEIPRVLGNCYSIERINPADIDATWNWKKIEKGTPGYSYLDPQP